MARCEDFPCCGHEAGCCPSYDEAGRQTDMVCTCGARLPVDNRYSICDSCLSREDESTPFDYYDEEQYDNEDDFDGYEDQFLDGMYEE